MTPFLRWGVFNFSILGLFLHGSITGYALSLNIGLFFLWVTAIIGLLLLIQDEGMLHKSMSQGKPVKLIPRFIDVPFDLVVVGSLAAFGYFALAGLYLLQMLAMDKVRKVVKTIGWD